MQRAIRTIKEPIHAKVTIPGSRSITHRALLLAALADGVSEISGIQISRDTLILINALRHVGIVAQLDQKGLSCIIAGGNGKFPQKQANIWCDNTKKIAHFLIAACATSTGVYYIDGATHLRQQDIAGLLNILCCQGVQLIPNDARHLPFTLIGSDSLEGGEIIFDENTSSQLVSALLMIAPYARSSFNFNNLGLVKQDYIDMTCSMMAEFGVLVHRIHQGQFMVPVPQRYQARDYTVEPDFSLASYFFAAAALTQGEVTIQPTKRILSKQANVRFLSALEKMGCRIIEAHKGLTVKGPEKLEGIDISVRDFSDTFLILVALAPFARTPTRITHIDKINAKSSQRLAIVKNELMKLRIQVESGDDWIKIFPSLPLGGLIQTHGDYRIAMAFSIIGLKAPGLIIDDAKCINKKYPDFFAQWDNLAEASDVSA